MVFLFTVFTIATQLPNFHGIDVIDVLVGIGKWLGMPLTAILAALKQKTSKAFLWISGFYALSGSVGVAALVLGRVEFLGTDKVLIMVSCFVLAIITFWQILSRRRSIKPS